VLRQRLEVAPPKSIQCIPPPQKLILHPCLGRQRPEVTTDHIWRHWVCIYTSVFLCTQPVGSNGKASDLCSGNTQSTSQLGTPTVLIEDSHDFFLL
jgi:hypothetical protein